jgi:hypothetical protein
VKTLKTIAAVTAFLVLGLSPELRGQEPASQAPPVEQTLVREGEFAVKLVERLGMGTPQNEAEAETMLSSKEISPQNGWISDYPLTPDIIRELQNSVIEAANASRLPMGREEALRVFKDLAVEVGLNVVAESQTEYPSEPPPEAYSYYPEPTVVSYYYSYGPPVITYYPPPDPYLYLYAWVPYPFWWTGWYFPGFYVLHDFHRCIYIHHPHHPHHHYVYVSNHWKDPKTRRVFVIDPSRRHTGEFMRSRVVGAPGGFASPEARRGAASIFEQSRGRVKPRAHEVTKPGRPRVSQDPSSSRPGETIERRSSNRRPGNPSSYGGTPPQVRGPIGNQRTRRPSVEAGSRGRGVKESNRFTGVGRPHGTAYTRIGGNQSRSYTPPTRSLGKSFNSPSHGGVKSFTPFNLGSRGSFGMPHRSTGGFGFGWGGR